MQGTEQQPTIPESFFELRQVFATNWVELWGKPANPFLAAILPLAESNGVELADVSFNTSPPNLGEVSMNVLFRKMRAALRVNLSSATFLAENPNWEEAPELVQLFEQLAAQIRVVSEQAPKLQECSLAFHIKPGTSNFGPATRRLIREDIVGDGEYYGVTRHRVDSAMTIDKSVKYRGGIFVRLQRTLAGSAPIAEAALALLEDEKEALGLLGINEIPNS